MWRSSYSASLPVTSFKVFSTYVEVILNKFFPCTSIASILHVCGGHPNQPKKSAHYFQYSPRMWRSSPSGPVKTVPVEVFSTYVEVILGLIPLSLKPSGILHVCGGHPHSDRVAVLDYEYSPRMWRSS